MDFKILFLRHLKKGSLSPLNDPPQPLEDGRQQIEGKAEEKRDPKKPEEAFIKSFGPLEEREISQKEGKGDGENQDRNRMAYFLGPSAKPIRKHL